MYNLEEKQESKPSNSPIKLPYMFLLEILEVKKIW